MTAEEFAFKWKHEWRGLLLDTWLGRPAEHGLELSIRLRQLEQKIEQNLRQMYQDAQPKPVANGQPAVKPGQAVTAK